MEKRRHPSVKKKKETANQRLESVQERLRFEIEERKLVEEALRESLLRFRDIAFSIPGWIWEMNKDGRFTYSSEQITDILGYSVDEILQKIISDLLAEKDHEFCDVFKDGTFLPKSIKEREIWFLHRNGGRVCLLTNGIPVLNPKGDFVGFRGVGKDITAQKTAETALQKSEIKFRNLFENAEVGMFRCTTGDFLLLESNPKFHSLFAANGPGPDFLPEGIMHPVLRNVLLRHATEGNALKDFEMAFPGSKGQILTFLLSAKSDPEAGMIQGSIVDITDRKKTEEVLRTMNRKLEEFDKHKSDFLAAVSHELRTPIAIMREGVSLCLDGVVGAITPSQKDILDSTLESVDRLTRLVTDLLDLSKIEAGKARLRRSVFDIGAWIMRLKDNYENHIREKAIRMDVRVPNGPVWIFADQDKVSQIFDNLVSNAVRFTPAGGRITIEVEDQEADVIFRVADTGIGIDHPDLEKLFSKFEQIGRTEGPGYRGTGLGLAIVKGFVEKHEGMIRAESQKGKGTTFIFNLKKKPFPRILVVDDEAVIVRVTRRLLENEHYSVLEATSGYEAIDKAREQRPSLILLDLQMPEMNGYEVLRRLRQTEETCSIPVLLMTGFAIEEQHLVETLDNANIPVIGKPFKPELLRTKIKDMLVE